MHTWGVKRTLDEKEVEIKQALQDGQRYYPSSEKTGLDEWGALLKH